MRGRALRSFVRRIERGGIASLGLAVVSALLVLPVAIRLRQVLRRARGDGPCTGDVIVVLGQALIGDDVGRGFAARLSHAEGLWRAGAAPCILVAGGVTGTATRSEAAAGVEWLLARGVPQAALLAEEQSLSTLENLTNVRPFMRAHGFDRIILVSDPLHLGRAAAMAGQMQLRVSCSPAMSCPPPRGSFAWYRGALLEAFYLHWYHTRAFFGRRGV